MHTFYVSVAHALVYIYTFTYDTVNFLLSSLLEQWECGKVSPNPVQCIPCCFSYSWSIKKIIISIHQNITHFSLSINWHDENLKVYMVIFKTIYCIVPWCMHLLQNNYYKKLYIFHGFKFREKPQNWNTYAYFKK